MVIFLFLHQISWKKYFISKSLIKKSQNRNLFFVSVMYEWRDKRTVVFGPFKAIWSVYLRDKGKCPFVDEDVVSNFAPR